MPPPDPDTAAPITLRDLMAPATLTRGSYHYWNAGAVDVTARCTHAPFIRLQP